MAVGTAGIGVRRTGGGVKDGQQFHEVRVLVSIDDDFGHVRTVAEVMGLVWHAVNVKKFNKDAPTICISGPRGTLREVLDSRHRAGHDV